MSSRLLLLPVALLLLGVWPVTVAAAPQQVRTVQDDEWCEDERNDDNERYCEVREVTLSADRDVIAVDAAPNGGVYVEGWDRNEILVRAKVVARADSRSEAREIAGEVGLDLGGTIEADGPRTGRDEGWWVSYRVFVPHRSNLNLESTNGGITIEDVDGRIEFRTTNGGIKLSRLKGDVNGRTTNGGVRVELEGDEWDGAGLDVQTTNGSVRLSIPEGYAAHLESGTTNGSFRIDFPITVQGRIDRRITAELGGGGRTIRAYTTNGSVVISRA
jgi:hypothetical protein